MKVLERLMVSDDDRTSKCGEISISTQFDGQTGDSDSDSYMRSPSSGDVGSVGGVVVVGDGLD